MWKCKKCGYEDDLFKMEIIKGSEDIFCDEDGEIEDSYNLEVEYGDIYCPNCENRGNVIKEIADWIEEE